MGDREVDDRRAIREYERGIVRNHRKRKPRFSLVIKYLGASIRARIVPPPDIVEVISSIRDDLHAHVPSHAIGGLHEVRHVQERWRIGRGPFLRRDFYAPKVRIVEPDAIVMGIGKAPALAPVASEQTSDPGPAGPVEAQSTKMPKESSHSAPQKKPKLTFLWRLLSPVARACKRVMGGVETP